MGEKVADSSLPRLHNEQRIDQTHFLSSHPPYSPSYLFFPRLPYILKFPSFSSSFLSVFPLVLKLYYIRGPSKYKKGVVGLRRMCSRSDFQLFTKECFVPYIPTAVTCSNPMAKTLWPFSTATNPVDWVMAGDEEKKKEFKRKKESRRDTRTGNCSLEGDDGDVSIASIRI